MGAALRFNGIRKHFPGVRALNDVSFEVRAGSVHGLMGENGAGKSTLMKILGGDYQPDAGDVVINGTVRRFAGTRESLLAGVAIVHQELQLVPELTVAENLMLGRFPGRYGRVDFRRMFEYVGTRLAGIGIDVDPRAKVASLSLGQAQMVEISKAVMFDARIIALDEPTSSLSSVESEVLYRLVDRLRAEGRSIIYISHRMDEVFRLCDAATVLRDGGVAAHFTDLAGVGRDTIVRHMVGREISDIWGYRPRPLGAVRLDVRGLSGPRLARPASFGVRAGEILGFFGLVGAGRSELMRLVYGADPAHGGEVRLDGQAVTIRHPRHAIRHGLVLCPEDRKAEGILQGRSVEENINIACRRHFSPLGFWIDRRTEAANADRFIQRLRIRTPHRRQDIVNLSGGNQQKAILSRWLADPEVKVLIVDEPTRGVDVGAKREIYDVLYELADRGMAVVVISSELPEVMGISDRILVMCEGSISAELPREAFSETGILAKALPQRAAA